MAATILLLPSFLLVVKSSPTILSKRSVFILTTSVACMFLFRTCVSLCTSTVTSGPKTLTQKGKYRSFYGRTTAESISSLFSLNAAATSDNESNGKVQVEGKSGRDYNQKDDGDDLLLKEGSTTKSTTNRPRTGWLHNTKAGDRNKITGKSTTTTGELAKAQRPIQEAMKEQREIKSTSVRKDGGNNLSAKGESTEKLTTNKLRTGWLHNTKAKTAKESSTTTDGLSKAQQRLQQAMKEQREIHRIVSPGALHACGKDRQIVVTEHRLSVPVNYDNEEKGRIDVAFTIVEEIKDEGSRRWFESTFKALTPSQRATAYVERCAMISADGMLIFLQGGPGFGAPTPIIALDFTKGCGSWGAAALDRYRRVVLMDQRGTGHSVPITKQSLEHRFPSLFGLDDAGVKSDDTKDQADIMDHLQESYPKEFRNFTNSLDDATEFLSQFRADNIVRDAEMIREALLLPTSIDDDIPRPWGCSLGQSFGGFCTMTYLSMIKHPPKVSLLTGGIAPMLANSAVDVYTSLLKKVQERNFRYYDMYPEDIALVKAIVRKLLQVEKEDGTAVMLPSGGKLTARRFLQLGMMLGGSPSSFASMHQLLSSAFLQSTTGEVQQKVFTRGFLKKVENEQSFDETPIYFWLHESIYADGKRRKEENLVDIATKWSANAVYENTSTRSGEAIEDEYDYRLTSHEDNEQPVLFSGEMIFPWMTEDYKEIGGIGCNALAHALANKDDWGSLYDAEHMRAVLGDGRTRSAAAIYYDDLYVDFDHCMKVTSRNGPLEKCKVYITNEYQHSGLRDNGAAIFSKLHGMATGSIRNPS